jgi:ATP-dependent helicase/nuclease subunit A
MERAGTRELLSRPGGKVDLWREKQFEIVLDSKWVAGVFDRVVIERDADGKALRASVLDYKSDRIGQQSEIRATAEKYRGQLTLYGRALSRILRLDQSQITLELLFTRPAAEGNPSSRQTIVL